MNFLNLSFISLLAFYSLVSPHHSAWAKSQPYLAVGKAKAKKTIMAFPSIKISKKESGSKSIAQAIHKVVKNDLVFMDLFKFLGPEGYIEKTEKAGLLPDKFKFSDWTTVKVQILLKTGIEVKEGKITLNAYLYDVEKGKQIISKKLIASTKDQQTLGHTLANEVVEALTGLPGIFLTKIAMACDRTGKKEVYIMNFDGSAVKQITSHRSNAFAPAWSPDGTKLAYSLYTRHHKKKESGQKITKKNMDLYEFDFKTRSIRLLSNRKGINSGAHYHPSGKSIALTMSFLGNPEIFSLDRKTRRATRLTKSWGFDVDPAWSPDGKKLAYVSSKTGKPMIFVMNADGSSKKRLTYAGRYNSTPAWSPQSQKIAFAGWLDKGFDIFTINPDGTNIQRLTKKQGSNEDPDFSPDGNFIAFSSDRTGKRNIYVMNVDGSYVKRLTYGLGNCSTPRWSNPAQATRPAP